MRVCFHFSPSFGTDSLSFRDFFFFSIHDFVLLCFSHTDRGMAWKIVCMCMCMCLFSVPNEKPSKMLFRFPPIIENHVWCRYDTTSRIAFILLLLLRKPRSLRVRVYSQPSFHYIMGRRHKRNDADFIGLTLWTVDS